MLCAPAPCPASKLLHYTSLQDALGCCHCLHPHQSSCCIFLHQNENNVCDCGSFFAHSWRISTFMLSTNASNCYFVHGSYLKCARLHNTSYLCRKIRLTGTTMVSQVTALLWQMIIAFVLPLLKRWLHSGGSSVAAIVQAVPLTSCPLNTSAPHQCSCCHSNAPRQLLSLQLLLYMWSQISLFLHQNTSPTLQRQPLSLPLVD